jgi:tripartite-type tricarboxylate transporter receptor subunit TctC
MIVRAASNEAAHHIGIVTMNPISISVGALLVIAAGSSLAQSASNYPNKAVRMIVPFAAGGGTDVVARAVASKLSEVWGQQVIADNRPGGSTIIGIDLTAKSPPDGYTLAMASTSYGINASSGRKLPYDPHKDLAYVAQTALQPYVITVHPALPVKTVKEFIALAKARPGALNYGSPGVGSGSHLVVELFQIVTGTRMVLVPYKGSAPALADLIGGQTQFMFATILAVAPHLKSGRLKGLATTGSKRSLALPELPTAIEAGVTGYAPISWTGIMAPAATPQDIRDKIQRDIVKVMATPEVRKRLEADGGEPVSGTSADFAALIQAEIATWTKVFKTTGIKPE